jgi:hypothetical protein
VGESPDIESASGCEGGGATGCVMVGEKEGEFDSASDRSWRTASSEGESDTRLLKGSLLGVADRWPDSIIVTGLSRWLNQRSVIADGLDNHRVYLRRAASESENMSMVGSVV